MSFVIYLIGTLDTINKIFIGMTIAPAVMWGLTWFIQLITLEDKEASSWVKNNIVVYRKRLLVTFFIFLPLATFSPNTKTLVAMYLIPKVVYALEESEQARNIGKELAYIPENTLALLNTELKVYLTDAKAQLGISQQGLSNTIANVKGQVSSNITERLKSK